jgi:rod shape-determining protein MreD
MYENFSPLHFGQYFLAYALIALLFVLSLVQIALPFAGTVRPSFIIIFLYSFAIYRPTLLPAILIFVMGIIYDLFLGYPLALHVIIFLTLFWVIKRQRLFFLGQSYLAIWLGFMLASLSYFLSEYVFFSLYLKILLPIWPLMGSFALTVLMFPLLSYVFIKLHNMLPAPASSAGKVE